MSSVYIIDSIYNRYNYIEKLIEYLHKEYSLLDFYIKELLVFPIFKTPNTGALLNTEFWFYFYSNYF